jgi:hypothetical protein
MSRRTRRALAAVFTFVVAAVSGVVGNHIAGSITPALVVFAVLIVLGAIPTYYLGQSDDSAAAPLPLPAQDEPGPVMAMGSGSVAVGGDNAGSIATTVHPPVDPQSQQ